MADQPVAWITRQTKDGKQRLEFGNSPNKAAIIWQNMLAAARKGE